MMTEQNKRRRLFLLLAGLMLLVLLSLLLGRYPKAGFLRPGDVVDDPLTRQLILQLRLPRILAALLLGASLGAAGLSFQMLFANPLVEPGFLGVSQGSAFGASLAIIFFGAREYAIQLSAFGFAVVGLLFSFYLAHKIRFGGWILRLVLAGIAVSALFTAGLGFLKYVADPVRELPEITFWLLGGLWGITWTRLVSILPLCVPGLVILFLFRWRVNALSLQDETIHALGVQPTWERVLVLGSAVAAAASVISIAGIVGWVGLIVPHMARRLFNVNTRFSLPGSMILGALFVLFCDGFIRVVLASELPLGILTSLFGAVAFLLLMVLRRKGIS